MHTRRGEASAPDAAQPLEKDLETREDVEFKTYWIGQKAASDFWLIDAPDAEAAHAVHREAHGSVFGEISEVRP
ncbi:MAG: DUF4242 domain-containing protein, partial [Solirubrobacterales bacterium]|nr:DUF4242 domain-containing protein [Solirubrobacterales bacterium]